MKMMLGSIKVSFEAHGHEYKVRPGIKVVIFLQEHSPLQVWWQNRWRERSNQGCSFNKNIKWQRGKGTEGTYK